jgi:hypothetical protein
VAGGARRGGYISTTHRFRGGVDLGEEVGVVADLAQLHQHVVQARALLDGQLLGLGRHGSTCSASQSSGADLKNVGKSQPVQTSGPDNYVPEVVPLISEMCCRPAPCLEATALALHARGNPWRSMEHTHRRRWLGHTTAVAADHEHSKGSTDSVPKMSNEFGVFSLCLRSNFFIPVGDQAQQPGARHRHICGVRWLLAAAGRQAGRHLGT